MQMKRGRAGVSSELVAAIRRPMSVNLRYAIAGAVFFELISVSATHGFSGAQVPGHLEALLLGSVAGWMFGAFQSQIARGKEFAEDIERLTLKLELQEDALQMLLDCPSHGEVLSHLIHRSAQQYRSIPHVSRLDYLAVLREAIEHSHQYQGVQRKPARWFLEKDGPTYLEALRDSPVKQKTRLFIIDDDDVSTMEEDLGSEVIERYWELTGRDVTTFWISVADFRRAFPRLQVPGDSALYDQSLAIEYDPQQHLLFFDVLAAHSNVPRLEIFRQLRLQLSNDNHGGPFTALSPS
jgi:hypothetical protein